MYSTFYKLADYHQLLITLSITAYCLVLPFCWYFMKWNNTDLFSAQQIFENLCIYCGKFGEQIPITFVLGFYVTLVVNRWWDQFESIPWPDSASLWVSTCIQGHDERGRLMRRTIVRYLNLGFILCLRLTCLPVKKRFPTLEHLVEAGILEEKEKEVG